MGTRADFYIGRGKDTEWIGSICSDGYPGPPPGLTGWAYKARFFDCMTDEQFRRAVEWIDSQVDHCYRPGRDDWPWIWIDSRNTDWIYAFDGGQVWITSFAHRWRTYGELIRFRDECQPIRDRIEFNYKHGDMERVGMLEEILDDLKIEFWKMDGPKHELPDMSAIAPHSFRTWDELHEHQRQQREEYEKA